MGKIRHEWPFFGLLITFIFEMNFVIRQQTSELTWPLIAFCIIFTYLDVVATRLWERDNE